MNDPIFFIALMPDEKVQQEVTAFKNECAGKFGTSHALKSPPHITLIPPFRLHIDRLPALKETLDLFALGQEPFKVALRNFNCFKPRVIYVDVTPNKSLTRLQQALQVKLSENHGLTDEQNRRFHPHMTIAHRDLPPKIFPAAWALFSQREYNRVFDANRVTLLRHTSGRWHIENDYFF